LPASATGYFRQPTVRGDAIVFVSEDDLWTVSTEGGVARRLTANPGVVSSPVLSPDGTRLAFTARDEGTPEAYVMDAEGGEATRLTWIGGMTQTVAWRPDGSAVLLATDWRQPFRGALHLHEVDADGGPVRPLRLGPSQSIAFEPQGRGVVIGRHTGDPARWKRYGGGRAGTLWIDRNGRGDYEPLLRVPGNVASPMWTGSRVWFLSDHEGHGNLYSCAPSGHDLRRHTHHEDFYVRHPATDGRHVVYHAGGDLWLLDVRGGLPRRLEVRTASARASRKRKFVDTARFLEGLDLHPKGHSLAVSSRGATFSMGLWDGPATRHPDPAKGRARLARWFPDGERIAVVSDDEGGEERLLVFSADGTKKPVRASGDLGRAIEMAVAPAGKDRVAVANHRYEVVLADVSTGRTKVVERSEHDRIEGLAWSPDGRWLAYGFPTGRRTCAIHLLDTTTGKVHEATRPEFRDVQPSFDPAGRRLYFVSWRIYDPVYDSHFFDLGFPKGSKPCALLLRAEDTSPFVREPSAPAATPAPSPPAAAAGAGGPAKKGPPPVRIDLAGLADRVVVFPVPEGRHGRVVGLPGGRALFTVHPVEGSLDVDWASTAEPRATARLQVFSFETQEAETLSEKVTGFTTSLDGQAVAIRSGNRVRVVSASLPPKEGRAHADGAKAEPGRSTGWVDLSRLRLPVSPADEWRQMFREAWRLQRDHFWTPDMSGVDWEEVHDRYLPLVERVSTRAELSDLLWEVQGELGTSHCYEMGGDHRPEPAWFQGFLGADLEQDPRTGAWRVARVLKGDVWDPKRGGPLAAPGLDVREGDEVVRVGGHPVSRTVSPASLLVHLPETEVALTLRRGKAAPRTVTVKTLKDEAPLRYREWVEANRERVRERTRGRAGYLHVPNMGPSGYAEFHRAYGAEVDRDALVVDLRWNGGGHVSQLLLEKLARRRIAYNASRWSKPQSYPEDAPMGPMVAITNENAGSDGDIFSHSWKIYGLGPLVGKRTWGGVVGIWPRHALADGTLTTQPEFAWWFQDVGWKVEGYGTDPDVEVDVRPQDHRAGKDPQLDTAIDEVLRLLRENPGAVPSLGDRPVRRARRLPAPAPTEVRAKT
jgi:tricorn protease